MRRLAPAEPAQFRSQRPQRLWNWALPPRPGQPRKLFAANHIRALLGLLAQGKVALAQGMNKDFIRGSEHNEEVSQKPLF
jgi:hypothetical protein